MLVTKCDICKKEIKDREGVITAGAGYSFYNNSFCLKCGKPVLDFLKDKCYNKNSKNKHKTAKALANQVSTK